MTLKKPDTSNVRRYFQTVLIVRVNKYPRSFSFHFTNFLYCIRYRDKHSLFRLMQGLVAIGVVNCLMR